MRIDEENIYNNDFDSLLALGLMSGTSIDGVDVALLKTNGLDNIINKGYQTYSFSKKIKNKIENFITARNSPKEITKLITDFHTSCVKDFIKKKNISLGSINIVGFHGQTIFHKPDQCWTWQLGDGQQLSNSLNIPVISNFRYRDVCLGGQGAPLVPIWHLAIINSMEREKFPCVFINIGGVANITYIEDKNKIPISFDIGPGNAPLDFVMKKYFNKDFDSDGAESAHGTIALTSVNNILSDSWFDLLPPKSLDKNELDKVLTRHIKHLNPSDKAATLAKLVSSSAKKSMSFFSTPPKALYVCGGGRLNKTIMNGFNQEFGNIICSVDELGWNGDALEAGAFAYLAVRSLKGMSFTWKNTTGVSRATSGGLLSHPY